MMPPKNTMARTMQRTIVADILKVCFGVFVFPIAANFGTLKFLLHPGQVTLVPKREISASSVSRQCGQTISIVLISVSRLRIGPRTSRVFPRRFRRSAWFIVSHVSIRPFRFGRGAWGVVCSLSFFEIDHPVQILLRNSEPVFHSPDSLFDLLFATHETRPRNICFAAPSAIFWPNLVLEHINLVRCAGLADFRKKLEFRFEKGW